MTPRLPRRNHGRRCEVCRRRAGFAPLNRFGEQDLNPETLLGKVTRCPVCGRFSCPDCQCEGECHDTEES